MSSSLICFYLFFLYISFGTFFGQGIAPASQRGVKQCNQNMESDILRQQSLALSPWPSKAFKSHNSIGSVLVVYSFCMSFVISFTSHLRSCRWLVSSKNSFKFHCFCIHFAVFNCLNKLFQNSISFVISEFTFSLFLESLSFIAYSMMVSLFSCLILLNKYLAYCFVSVWSGDLIFFSLLHKSQFYIVPCSVNIWLSA